MRSFVVLADRLHFGRTAELLNLSQPALSKQIGLLESELGTPLFSRDRHGVNLTEAGKSFLDEARALVRHFDEVCEYGKRVAQGTTGRLSVGFGFSTVTLVPRLISLFRKTYPHVQINLQDLSSGEQLESLERRNIDIGFTRIPVDPKFQQKTILEDRLVLALPKNFHHSDQMLDLADFKDKGFIMYSRNRSAHIYDHVLRVCAAYHFYPKIVQETFELPTMLAFVAAGLGVALVPESQFRVRFKGVIYRQLANPVTSWKVGAIWRKESGQPLTNAFVEVLNAEINRG